MPVSFKNTFLFIFILYSGISNAFSQQKYTVSGYVKDKSTGESFIGVNVYNKENIQQVTSTNTYGFYSLSLPQGRYTLVFQYIGYQKKEVQLTLDKDQKLIVDLEKAVIETKEVTITGERSDKNVQGSEMGTVQLSMDKMRTIPALLGEVDILKVIQLLPGVQSAGEGNSGYYVRGGGPDQNLIMLDEAVVYNASHLFGFFSVFNGDAVKDIELIKGGMPAQYGGRLASVLNVNMNEGNNRKLSVHGGLGLISSRLTVEGPIKKDTASFMVSARRTYIDVLMKPFIKKTSAFKGTGYYFYDLNTKINYILSDKDRLFLSGYFGRDVFSYSNNTAGFKVSIPWGNATGSLRWNHLFTNKLFLNTSLIFSDYKFEFGATQSDFEFKLFSGIRDYNAKFDFNYFPSIRHKIKFGGNYVYHTFTPSNASAKQGDLVFDTGDIIKLYAHEAALYVSDDFDVTEKLRIHAGFRYSQFIQVGPFDRFLKNETGRINDTINYKPGEKIAAYGGPEPRASLRYTLGHTSSVKASYTRNYQYIHLASLSAVSLPTDVWLPSTSLVKPQLGTQYALGYFRNFKENTYETSVEVYYKEMKNQVEYKEGTLPGDNVKDNPDNSLTFGDGRSYGAEFFLKKALGKFNGWIGYTLAKTVRKFPEINSGLEFSAKYDRRHDASVVLTYDLNPKLSFTAVFVYATGNRATLPVQRYIIENRIVNEYGTRNSYTMPSYHRADVSVNYIAKKTEKFESSWNFSVYNLYNRHNPYFIYFNNEGDLSKGELEVSARQVSLFPILPSVTWNFKF